MLDANYMLNINLGGINRSISLTNSFGKVYPVFCDDLLVQIFDIKPDHKVLDIGGGSNPFKRADTVTEPYVDNAAHRSGLEASTDVKAIECFAEALPFSTREFDFALSRQVFEHTNSPLNACNEMMRVAKRGFIETPKKQYELLFGPNPSHNWFVSVKNDIIVFERRMFVRHPLRHIGLSLIPSSHEGQLLLHWEFKNLTNIQFYWENTLKVEVIDSPKGFDYQNLLHASEAHLDSAICGLLHGGFYLPHRKNDAIQAIKLRPDWALAHNTLGIILWKQKKYAEAIKEFKRAAELDNREEFMFNAKLKDVSVAPVLVDFEYTLPIDDDFFSKYYKTSYFDIISYLS